MARGIDDIGHEGLRVLLRQEGVTFQHLKPGRSPRTALCGEEGEDKLYRHIKPRKTRFLEFRRYLRTRIAITSATTSART